MTHQNSLITVKFSNCNILSSDLELLDFFKYIKIKSRIKLDIEIDYPKF